MSQQEMATDRLVSIIQSIQIAQGSGILTVRRGNGSMLEEGSIVFLNGQAKQTTAGRRSGIEARNWLSTWGPCRYIFVPSQGTNHTQVAFTQTGNPSTSDGSPEHNGHNRQIQSVIQATPPTLHLGIPSSHPTLHNGLNHKQAEPQTNGYLKPGVPHALPAEAPQPGARATTNASPLQKPDKALDKIDQNRLSRTHRRLFLLIDGQRSIVELARLTGKKPEEIRILLHELEDIGIIQAGGQ